MEVIKLVHLNYGVRKKPRVNFANIFGAKTRAEFMQIILILLMATYLAKFCQNMALISKAVAITFQ